MIKVYGADWCEDTKKARDFLDSAGVDYEYIDVEKDAAASRWVKEQNDGKERKPTVAIDDEVLSVPGEEELNLALQKKGLLA